jgi:hypothetical protein
MPIFAIKIYNADCPFVTHFYDIFYLYACDTFYDAKKFKFKQIKNKF